MQLIESVERSQFFTIILAAVLLVVLVLLIVFLLRRRRPKTRSYDEMEGHEFEYFCADLLEKRGFEEVEVTKGSGDYGVDILAEKDGVTYAIQCKRYDGPVGVKAVQEAYAGRDYYDRMVGAVLNHSGCRSSEKAQDSAVGWRIFGEHDGRVEANNGLNRLM